ncbi:hypothetical protein FM104_03425 [Microbacterium esteraromaticum]|uniref:PIN domain-containing protein n=1 Tax=Microbacterium esteraromaticum TaxID=57043 RepID=A0A1R4IQU2_9MICO|nr:hypothetical protein [Microbacterium esteraromaticum]SJN22242.1 hypothetical protein FM104_03425 [Microbacterium esteraromaticum]
MPDLHLVNIAAVNGCALVTFDARIRQLLRPDERHLVKLWS